MISRSPEGRLWRTISTSIPINEGARISCAILSALALTSGSLEDRSFSTAGSALGPRRMRASSEASLLAISSECKFRTSAHARSSSSGRSMHPLNAADRRNTTDASLTLFRVSVINYLGLTRVILNVKSILIVPIVWATPFGNICILPSRAITRVCGYFLLTSTDASSWRSARSPSKIEFSRRKF